MPSRGGKSNSRKAIKSPKSPNPKEPKNDKSAPSATVTDLLKKAALQKTSASIITTDGASVSVSVKSKNSNMESQDDSLSLSTSPKPIADEETSQTPEILPKETDKTPDPAVEDETLNQEAEELPGSQIDFSNEEHHGSPTTLEEAVTPPEQQENLVEPSPNIFLTPEEDVLSDHDTREQNDDNTDETVILEPEKQKNSETSPSHSQSSSRLQSRRSSSPSFRTFQDTLKEAESSYQNRRSASSPSVSQLIPKFDRTSTQNDHRRVDMRAFILEENEKIKKSFREDNENLKTSFEDILSTKIAQMTSLVQSNTSRISENETQISSLQAQLSNLQEANSLQSSQLEEIQISHRRTENSLTNRINELEASLATQTSLIESQGQYMATTNSTLTETIKDVNDLKDNPTELSQEAINARVQEIMKQKDFEAHWQRELDKSAQKLVFKNLKKTPETTNLHPNEIFKNYILQPMNANWEDKAMMTPTAVIDLNRNKPDFNSHLLLCSFGSMEGISLIKRNASNIPRGVTFNLSVPTPYSPHLNQFLKQQKALRMIKDKDGNTLVRSRISKNQGYLILETSDRINEDNWSAYCTKASFIPSSDETVPCISIASTTPKYTLLQYHWETPLPSPDQKRISDLLKTCDTMNFSFNRTGYSLAVTIKHELEERIQSKLRQDPQIAAARPQKVAH